MPRYKCLHFWGAAMRETANKSRESIFLVCGIVD